MDISLLKQKDFGAVSMYSGDLKSGQVWSSNGRKEVGLQMIPIPKWDLKAGTPTIWIPDKKSLDFEWSSFWMVGTITIAKARTFENGTIRNLTFKKSRFQMFPDFRSPLYTLLYVGHAVGTKAFYSGDLNYRLVFKWSKLVWYSSHDLNNWLLQGIWIADN